MVETMQVIEVKKILLEMKNCNKSFDFCFNCLNFNEKFIQKTIYKAVHKALKTQSNKKTKLIKRARFLLKDDITTVKKNIKELEKLVEDSQKILEHYNSIKNFLLAEKYSEVSNCSEVGDEMRLIITAKAFQYNLEKAKNSVIPKANYEVEQKILIQEQINFLYQQVPAMLQQDEDYEFKFGQE